MSIGSDSSEDDDLSISVSSDDLAAEAAAMEAELAAAAEEELAHAQENKVDDVELAIAHAKRLADAPAYGSLQSLVGSPSSESMQHRARRRSFSGSPAAARAKSPAVGAASPASATSRASPAPSAASAEGGSPPVNILQNTFSD